MAKRVPPSQRPERQLDEVAKAIARAKDEAKAEKTAEIERQAADGSKQRSNYSSSGNLTTPRKPTGPVVATSTKRPKAI